MTDCRDTVNTRGSAPELTKKQREESRAALVGDRASKALEFQTKATRKFGPAAGIFLRQLLFWQGREADPDGWIYKSRREMQDETGLNQKQQEKARKALRAAGVLEEDRRPVGALKRATLHYKVNYPKLMEIFAPEEKASTAPATPLHTYTVQENAEPLDFALDDLDGDVEGGIATENPIRDQVSKPLYSALYRKPYSESTIQKSTSEEVLQKSTPYRGRNTAFAASDTSQTAIKEDGFSPTEQRPLPYDDPEHLLKLRSGMKDPDCFIGRKLLEIAEGAKRDMEASR